jgi:predicted enzyme related to lactoylglutathione lyase
MTCPIVWFEAVGQHADKLHSFYGEVLGWRFRAPTPQLADARPAYAGHGRVRDAAPEAPPWWVSFYTRVPDLDAAIATARSLGGRVLVAPTRMGASMIAVVSDPEGHPLGLCS